MRGAGRLANISLSFNKEVSTAGKAESPAKLESWKQDPQIKMHPLTVVTSVTV